MPRVAIKIKPRGRALEVWVGYRTGEILLFFACETELEEARDSMRHLLFRKCSNAWVSAWVYLLEGVSPPPHFSAFTALTHPRQIRKDCY